MSNSYINKKREALYTGFLSVEINGLTHTSSNKNIVG